MLAKIASVIPMYELEQVQLADVDKISNLALIRFWDASTSEAPDITWQLLFDSIVPYLNLRDGSDFNNEQLRRILDSEGNIERQTLKLLYPVIQNEDPKDFLRKFITLSVRKRSQLDLPFFAKHQYVKIGWIKLSRNNSILVGIIMILVFIGTIIGVVV